jgi:Cytochrome C oxidase, cbb3-type, subunit III
MKPMLRTVLQSLSLLLLAACGGSDDDDGDDPWVKYAVKVPGPVAGVSKEATELFRSLCSTCHGMTGHGDGPGSLALTPKPRSFADQAWQKSVTDEQIRRTITFGGAGVGKSPMMPAQPQLKSQPQVLDGLILIVRSYATP